MFVYSLAGLKVDGSALQETELEDNAITARLGVYQVLARLASAPDCDAYETAAAGEWGSRLRDAAKLLPFEFDFGDATLDPSATAETLRAEFFRAFEAGDGSVPSAPIYGGAYVPNRDQRLGEVVRAYEYFGLSVSAEDPRPADHLATELEFMKFLTFKEAVSASPRLQASYRRAQHEFLDGQLNAWLPQFVERTESAETWPFWRWVAQTVARFAAADARHVACAVVG